MKKFLTIVVVIALIFGIALAAIPSLFKDRIMTFVKNTANRRLTATVNFSDVDISLLKNFPRATVIVRDFSVANAAPFLGDTLFSAKTIDVTVDPLPYFREGVVEIIALRLDEPGVRLRALNDSLKNWRVMKPTDEQSDSSSLALALKTYSIVNGRFYFRSESADRTLTLDDIQHEGTGDFANDVFTLVTRTDARAGFSQRGANYMNDARAQLTAEIGVDLKNNVYTFKENELKLNELRAGFEGFIGLPDDRDDIDMDIKFATRDADFKAFLSVVPAMYSSNFNELKASGAANVIGFVRGAYNDTTYPAFDLRAVVQNGIADHPKLPAALKAVALDFQAQSPGGDLDNAVINVRQLSLLLAGNPFDLSLEARTPISDPNITASAKGRINLTDVKTLVESDALDKIKSGVVTMEVQFRGAMSAVKNKDYQRFNVAGLANLEGFEMASDSLPEPVSIASATLKFSPQKVLLSNCRILLGKSDVELDGDLENFIPYVLYDDVVKGSLRLTSSFLDLNPWMKKSDGEKTTPQTEEKENPKGENPTLTSVELPGNIDFSMQAAMKRVLFSNLDLSNAQGTITIRNKVLRFENMGVRLLGAQMLASGAYNTQNPLEPKTEFALQISDVAIRAMYEKFMTIQEFAPFARYLDGDMALKIKLATDLDGNLKPVWNTFGSEGGVSIGTLKLENFQPFNALADALKIDALRNPTLSKMNAFYEIKNGRFYLKPLKTKIAGMDVDVEGSNGLDKSLDYRLNLVVPTDKLTDAAIGALSNLGGGVNWQALKPKTIPVGVRITGTIEHPVLQFALQSAENAAQQLLDAAQEEAKRLAQEEIQKAQQKLQEEADKRAQELERKAKELEEKAKQEAEQKAKEAEQKAKEEIKKRLPFDIFGGKKDTTKK